MSKVTEFISKHKTAVGLGAAGLILLWLLTRGSSSGGTSGGAVNPLQLAQLEAANNQQNAQIGAQEYATQTQAQLQQNQNNEALESEQDQLAASVVGTAYSAQAQEQQTSASAALYEDLINTGAQEQLGQLQDETQLEEELAPQAIALTNKGGRTQAGVNELALILGQGNVGSYNAGTASASIASTLETGSIINNLTKGASSVLTGLF